MVDWLLLAIRVFVTYVYVLFLMWCLCDPFDIMLFNLYMLISFPKFPSSVYHFIPSGEYILCGFSYFKSTETYFRVSGMVYAGSCFMCLRIIWVKYFRISFRFFFFTVLSKSSIFILIPVRLFCVCDIRKHHQVLLNDSCFTDIQLKL